MKPTMKKTKTSLKREIEIPHKLPTKTLKSMTKHRSFVFYGRAGTGKTTLSMSFPGKILLLDVKDDGTDSVSDVDPKDGVGMRIEHWDDYEMVYYYLKKNKGEYATVVIDTMSQLQQLCVEKVLEDKGKSNKKAGEWGTLTKQDWGTVASLMKEWIISFRDLPMEKVFIAQDRIFNLPEDENDDQENAIAPEVGPRLSPSIAAHLNAAVSVVGNTFIREKFIKKVVDGKKQEIRKVQYCLRVGPNPVYVTKARKPKGYALPDVIVDPTYEDIISILTGE